MVSYNIYYSDLIIIRSDIYENIAIFNEPAAPKAKRSDQATFTVGSGGHTRIIGGALQTLRQSWMQMYGRQGAWPQILPDPVPGQGQTGRHLRSPGECQKGLRACTQLSPCARNAQGTVRYQSRAVAPQRSVLDIDYGTDCLMDRLVARSHVDSEHGRTDVDDIDWRYWYQGGC